MAAILVLQLLPSVPSLKGLYPTCRRKDMHRSKLIILGAASALFFTAGAQAKPRLTVDAAHDVHFGNYGTFDWAGTTPPRGFNSVQYQRVQRDITNKLAAKGYKHAPHGDLTLALSVGKLTKVDLDRYSHWGYHDTYSHSEGQVSLGRLRHQDEAGGVARSGHGRDQPEQAECGQAAGRGRRAARKVPVALGGKHRARDGDAKRRRSSAKRCVTPGRRASERAKPRCETRPTSAIHSRGGPSANNQECLLFGRRSVYAADQET
jgi:hypothetical protein